MLLMGESSASQVRYTQPGQLPKAAATLTSHDQAAGVILIEEEDLPIQFPMQYLSF